MSFFEKMTERPAPKIEEAEVKLDLSGMAKEDALKKLDAVVQSCKKTSSASLYVSFDPATGNGETLFQPVARYFKFEKYNEYVAYAVPLMTAEKGGLFVVFKK